jgi:hypothetical protein
VEAFGCGYPGRVPDLRLSARIAALVCISCATASWAGSTEAARPLTTAIFGSEFTGPEAGATMTRIRGAGATAVRIGLSWRSVSPSRPLDPTNPNDPAYRWGPYDRAIQLASKKGLKPIVTVYAAPDWAEGGNSSGPDGSVRPNAVEYGQFATAAARRYSGTLPALPRVRYWQAWNEPNITQFLNPQYEDGRPYSPALYRSMVNEFSSGVKSVVKDNIVIAGGTAPFRDVSPEVVKIDPKWGPLAFMRELLCLTPSLQPKCSEKIHFDIWAHHPYTSGGPTHHANLADDVSIGDLPQMKRVLDAGVKAGNVVSGRPVQFWVTEFSWDSSPPDPKGVPVNLEARWVAEALYRMWSSGVSLVTWFLLRDEPPATSYFQSGLLFRGKSVSTAKPKPAFTAFRFPLVGLPTRRGFLVWGRTPAGKPGRVLVEQSFNGGWARLGVLRTDSVGIFQKTFDRPATGFVRARLLGSRDRARPFGLRPVPDRFFNPFGTPPR